MEYLVFDDWFQEPPQGSSLPTLTTTTWKIHKYLVLGNRRCGRGTVRVGSCLVVVGGQGSGSGTMRSVEVLDTQRNTMWHLPDIAVGRSVCSIAVLSTGIFVMDYDMEDSGETLSLVDKNSACFVRLMALGKAPAKPPPARPQSYKNNTRSKRKYCGPW